MNDFVLAKSKVNNACQEINQKVYRLLLDALEATGPEKFLNAKFHFVSHHSKQFLVRSDLDAFPLVFQAKTGIASRWV